MANTIDADLLIDTLSNRVKTTLGNVLAPLNAFTRDFSPQVFVQGKNHQVQVTTGGSTTLTNPTNFETGDSTTSNVAVPISHYSQPFHVTSQQLNQRITLEGLADKNLQNLANKIMDVALAPVVAANFTSVSGDIAQTAIAVADIQAAWAAISKSPIKNILLDGVAFSKFLPTNKDSFVPGNGAYGFDGFYLNTRWTGAETGVYGFAAGPDAICMAAGIPDVHPAVKALMLSQNVVTIEGLGLSVQINVWGSAASRTVWASYDLFFGAAFGQDVSAGYIIQNTP
jgi:hypothetical protein